MEQVIPLTRKNALCAIALMPKIGKSALAERRLGASGWILRYVHPGRLREMGLRALRDVTLAAERRKLLKLLF
ncbi:MAG: hypothetical protein IPH08_11290 [Rhodocyclaceae bacterium]|jgi:hypothetical protein|nr:hypothetical protein [Rhodocyclaceae bacterium]MBK6907617.1 hypothetical protein [Rhodocyclaceae bacterium]